MDRKKIVGDVGVIVGRFQVPYLHEAHKDLIDTVMKEHKKVIIFLGLSPVRTTSRNPLDFEARKKMILESYPDVIVLYIKDTPNDKVWSDNLDTCIEDILSPTQTPILYGSRDSFINHYRGKHQTQELIPKSIISGSELRKLTSKVVKCAPEFREGVIWATSNQYPKVWPTVDIAILSEDNQNVLLARKPSEQLYRFIGGFVDPSDKSFEMAAMRELREEAGSIEVTPLTYISSHLVDDWRYANEKDRIMTSLFFANLVFGRPEPGDDICELRWFNLSKFDMYDKLVPTHYTLMTDLDNYYTNYCDREG
jgi:bifunctional NMN adenylyltransferase/nudix hydrolase